MRNGEELLREINIPLSDKYFDIYETLKNISKHFETTFINNRFNIYFCKELKLSIEYDTFMAYSKTYLIYLCLKGILE